jgi:hypothetical protein
MNDLNIGEPLAFEMNTDANGWVNLAVAYREYKEAPANAVDPVLVLFDIAALLKDTATIVEKLSDKLLTTPDEAIASRVSPAESLAQQQEAVGAD